MASKSRWLGLAALVAASFASVEARAQSEDELEVEATEVEESADDAYAAPPRTAEPVPEVVPPPEEAPPIEVAPPTDHALVVGRLGVGYLGVNSVPVCGNFDCTGGSVTAPTLGVRYWANERLGIEVGVGVGVSLGRRKVDDGTSEVTVEDPTIGAVALHGGLPLALMHSRHFTFLFSPEVQFGFAKGSDEFESVSGILVRGGFRIGAEVQFGFIGIPQLSLTAGVGLHGTMNHRAVSEIGGDASANATGFDFGTNVQGNPWAIFTNGISALYYF